MVLVLALFGVLALVTPAISAKLGPKVFPLLALLPAGVFAWTLAQAPLIRSGGELRETYAWLPELGISLAFQMDPLAWVLALLVTGVGTLVLLYCTWYFTPEEPNLGRFAAFLLLFAGVMWGLVLADDVIVMFVFWEITSVLSYLLIGHYTEKRSSRGAALQALLVTTLGGLAMLVGIVMLAGFAGTTSLQGIVESTPPGVGTSVAIGLVLAGAVSKSALVPFHFWLPAAMAAPTPVSAYLHAAAMVKAGVYLVARLAPGFAEDPVWIPIVIGLGLLTMLMGAYRSLRQHDLKLILAHGTVSQLGFIMVVVGFGTADTAVAGLALLFAHALYKAALFLVVGIIDHSTGTRDIRELSGLGRRQPVLVAIAALAAASMAGVPPLAGFVAKEAVFTTLLEADTPRGWVALVGVALGSILTVAYTARFLWGRSARVRAPTTLRCTVRRRGSSSRPRCWSSRASPRASRRSRWIRCWPSTPRTSAHPTTTSRSGTGSSRRSSSPSASSLSAACSSSPRRRSPSCRRPRTSCRADRMRHAPTGPPRAASTRARHGSPSSASGPACPATSAPSSSASSCSSAARCSSPAAGPRASCSGTTRRRSSSRCSWAWPRSRRPAPRTG
ncbi:proton-conducting transporter membrane subunit [Arenivirga flava]|uniref:NADH:quinone oxidoreductase/Mrp antiporter membrane subunit domain-containing protein n=1 Tax=Arenivirga flava TaxID=1930060 RepID=A0AA37XA37_9MICO|nr:hypothetical protein GCM10025874_25470 [Arenivirga flava]